MINKFRSVDFNGSCVFMLAIIYVLLCSAGSAFAAESLISVEDNISVKSNQSLDVKLNTEKNFEDGLDLKWILANAPKKYTVKKGDNFSSIAGVFLSTPWRWPALWGLSRSSDNNEQPLYQDEVLEFRVIGEKAKLYRTGSAKKQTRLSPEIRITEPTSVDSLVVSYPKIAPFLVKPLMMESDVFLKSATVLATKENRLNVGSGGRIYAAGIAESVATGELLSIYRPGRAIRDPDHLNEKDSMSLLGYEAIFLGEARLMSKNPADGISTLEVISSTQEISKSDRIVSIPNIKNTELNPKLTELTVNARVVMIHDGRTGSSLLSGSEQTRNYETEGGPMSIVVLNKGSTSGIQEGFVLDLMRPAQTDNEHSNRGYKNGLVITPAKKLPAEAYGKLIVFKTFAKVSYAVVINATTSVLAGDLVTTIEK